MNRIIGTSIELPIIKFQNRDIINKIQSGKMYLKNLDWFREYEKQTGDTVIGDMLEGMLHVSQGYMKITDLECNESNFFTLNDTAIKTSFSNAYVFCSTNIVLTKNGVAFNDDQKQELRTFGDSALIIKNKEEFINRICKAANNMNYKVFYGPVNYYSKDEDNAYMFASLVEGIHNIAFWKRYDYSLQQEFRIVLWKEGMHDEHIEFEIDNISDISEVLSIDEALKIKLERTQ